MTQVSERLNRLSESATLAMARKTRELKAEGKNIIGLSLGEPDFNTPDFIKDAAKEGIDQNYTSYTPVEGYADLKEAVINKFKRDNGLVYGMDQIVVSTGAKQSIANVMLSLVNPGDEVIVPAPYWVTYEEIVKLAEGTPVVIETSIDNDFKITAKELEEAITPKTKLMIFSSPCNPTGSLYSKEELRALADVIVKHPDLIVISDEIYEHINFVGKHQSLAQFNDVFDQVVTVNGLSKAFAMTGWRLGYIGAPSWIAKACIKMQGQVTSGTCSIAQRAAIAALNADPSVTHEMRDAFKRRRDFVLTELNKMEGVNINVPEGAFYVFPDVSSFFGKSNGDTKIQNADDLTMYLLMEAEVATVTGNAFGNKNCIRISYAASDEELKEAMQRIDKALSKLK
ncbi:pyridoxal phosphate-dependent aminotransferase [Parvicella tangerina]|uniref:Aminotransferase n=1 Tax=Parvicella tangerina TaxID=2829795 RepID=A0A916NC67_9FLAO|nr:pyridoxal phosphate-dependent aminotransferase [Parvicella tangerina]CAG5084587.1 Aspartate/prephenate aminotransferase [Parvicella tangerina]